MLPILLPTSFLNTFQKESDILKSRWSQHRTKTCLIRPRCCFHVKRCDRCSKDRWIAQTSLKLQTSILGGQKSYYIMNFWN